MLELAKFAKHHIPEDHELDDQDFVDKRIYTLGQFGITSALVGRIIFMSRISTKGWIIFMPKISARGR